MLLRVQCQKGKNAGLNFFGVRELNRVGYQIEI
jgi:hypothetical protein